MHTLAPLNSKLMRQSSPSDAPTRERSGIASAAGAHTYVIALLKRLPRNPRIEWPHDSAGPAGTQRSKLIRISVVKDMAWKLDDVVSYYVKVSKEPLTEQGGHTTRPAGPTPPRTV